MTNGPTRLCNPDGWWPKYTGGNDSGNDMEAACVYGRVNAVWTHKHAEFMAALFGTQLSKRLMYT